MNSRGVSEIKSLVFLVELGWNFCRGFVELR